MLIVFDNIETIRSWNDEISRLRYAFNPFERNLRANFSERAESNL